MDTSRIIERLASYPAAFRAAANLASAEDARWKPGPEHWSIVEICCHVLDEEREDFRPRIHSTLLTPAAAWPPLDLDGVAVKRRYNERDLAATLDAFTAARAESVAWLRTLTTADWSQAHVHPKVGAISAGDLLAAWTAHDALHLRQIGKRMYELAVRDGGPHTAPYAGALTA